MSRAYHDEHPPFKSNPAYIADGQNLTWQRVDAVVAGGGWADTVFILTWDDWGGHSDESCGSFRVRTRGFRPAGFARCGAASVRAQGGRLTAHKHHVTRRRVGTYAEVMVAERELLGQPTVVRNDDVVVDLRNFARTVPHLEMYPGIAVMR